MERQLVNVQTFTVFAQDPSVKIAGRPVMATLSVPAEHISNGPTGYRVKVVDFDATSGKFYPPINYVMDSTGKVVDPFTTPRGDATSAKWKKYFETIIGSPAFHAQNVYAISMRTLARFEYALGRRISWGFNGHQLHIAPHAFSQANAFYSRADRALLFGYFRPRPGSKPVFACLSHDVVAHETTHAVLDGLRQRFMEPSGPDQAGFHEGFADIVALLSVFALEETIAALLSDGRKLKENATLKQKDVTWDALSESTLLRLAEQMGNALSDGRMRALRNSVLIKPSKSLLQQDAYLEAHSRGEILVAAFMRSFLSIWVKRIEQLSVQEGNLRSLDLVVEQGARVAEHLLTMAIRALDYSPPVDISFADYLAALLTADTELVPDDSRFEYRKTLVEVFRSFGIEPPAGKTTSNGVWNYFEAQTTHARNHYESMLHDPEEVFRFIWENRKTFELDDRGYTEVESVRASRRVGPDGFILRETIVEYIQIASVWSGELKTRFDIDVPKEIPNTAKVRMFGGGTLVFDEYGKVKFHIAKPLGDVPRQSEKVQHLAKTGFYSNPTEELEPFAALHRARMGG